MKPPLGGDSYLYLWLGQVEYLSDEIKEKNGFRTLIMGKKKKGFDP